MSADSPGTVLNRLERPVFALALALCFAAFLLGPQAGHAQGYPTKPVRMIVPASPSGGQDILARIVAQPLTAMWGQSVVVDNRPGAGVMLGSEVASKAAPDGYTVLIINANLTPNAILHEKLSVVKNLTPVIKMADLPNVLTVPGSLPASSVKELIALARSSPLTYASTGHGTVGNICAEMLKLAIATEITHVPYKGGGPVMTALVGGQVSMGFVSLASANAFMKAGRVKVLAVASGRRSRLAPDIPTLAETLPGVELESWVGLMAPAGTPQPILRTLNAAVHKALGMPDVQQRLVDQGYDIRAGTPEEFGKLIQGDIAKYSKVIREAGIKTN